MATNKNVSIHEPCPICGKPDYCYWFPVAEGRLLACGRTRGVLREAVSGGDGKTYYVVKEKTAEGYCVYEDAEQKQASYEAWCRENGKTPQAKYAAVGSGGVVTFSAPSPKDEELSDPIAEPERLDEVYRAFLDLLILEKKDHASLSAEWKGYCERLVEKYKIRTMPPADKIRFGLKDRHPFFAGLFSLSRKEIMNRLVQKVGEPYGVPGFYVNQYNGLWTFANIAGIVFPVTDLHGRIIRLRIRDALPVCKGTYEGAEGEFRFSYNGEWEFTKKGEKGSEIVVSYEKNIFKVQLGNDFLPVGSKVNGKYKNFSSYSKVFKDGVYMNRYLHGTQSKSMPSVYAEPGDNFYTVYFTEGEKKAAVAHELLRAPVIAFPGVGFYSKMLHLDASNFDREKEDGSESIMDYLLSHGSKIGVICYDADKETNDNVLRHEQEAVKAFIQSGLYMAIGDWNSSFGKGLDDIVLAGVRPNIHPVILK